LPAIEIETSDKKDCAKCGGAVALNSSYCNHCGARQYGANVNSSENNWRLLKQAALFFAIDIFICCLCKFADAFKTLSWFVLLDILMAISAVVFFAINWAENKTLLIWRNFSWQKVSAYATIAVAASFLVHYSVGWLNVVIYSKDESYYAFAKGNLFGEIFVIFFTAVMPALFEELGYRGYLLQTLLKVADPEQAVYISAFIFAIIHMSFISLFWLIPFALFLGFVRLKEGTLWYGILIHFCFNLTACMFELL
jgi:membrane protease YdiL (CAAX protease family)